MWQKASTFVASESPLTFLQMMWFLLASSAKCESLGMRIRTSKSKAMVLSWKRVGSLLKFRDELLPQLEEFKYLGVLLTCDWRRELDRQIVGRSCSNANAASDRCDEESWPLDLSVNLRHMLSTCSDWWTKIYVNVLILQELNVSSIMDLTFHQLWLILLHTDWASYFLFSFIAKLGA